MSDGKSDRGALPCPNPYCDGYGWVQVDATSTTNAYCAPACTVGPHPPCDVERFIRALPAHVDAAVFIAEVFER